MANGITKKKAIEISDQFSNIAICLQQIHEGLSSEEGRQKFLDTWGGVEPLNALLSIQKIAKHNSLVANLMFTGK